MAMATLMRTTTQPTTTSTIAHSGNNNAMHTELLAQVLGERNLSKAGDLFMIDDSDIERDVEHAAQILRSIVNAPEYVHSPNDQSVVEICVTRLTAAIRETKSIDRHAVALAVLLESCLGHDLSCAAKDRDPPHAKIVADILSCIFMSRAHWTVIERILPTAIWLLTKGNRELCRSLTGYLCLAAADHAHLLASYLPLILNSILVHRNHLLIRILPYIYDENCDPIHVYLRDLLTRLSDCELAEKSAVFELCRLIATHRPQVLRPYISQLSLHLVSVSTSSAVLAIYADIATTTPDVLVRHLPRIRATAANQSSCIGAAAAILGCVARKCQAESKECVSNIISLFSTTADVHAHIALLCELRNTAEVRPEVVATFVGDIAHVAADTTSASVRLVAQQLVESLTDRRIKPRLDGGSSDVQHITLESTQTDTATSDSQIAICSVDSDGAIDCSGSVGSRLSFPVTGHNARQSHIDIYLSDLGSSWRHADDLGSRLPDMDSLYRRSDDSIGRAGGGGSLSRNRAERLDLSYSYQRLYEYPRLKPVCFPARGSSDGISTGDLALVPSRPTGPDGSYADRSPYFFPSLTGRRAARFSGPRASAPYPKSLRSPGNELVSYRPPQFFNTIGFTEGGARLVKNAGSGSIPRMNLHRPPYASLGPRGGRSCIAPLGGSHEMVLGYPADPAATGPSVLENRGASTLDSGTTLAPPPARDAVQQFCDKHLDKIRQYVAEVTYRLPLPSAIHPQGSGTKRSCVVEFSCDECGQFCLFDRRRFSLRTKNISSWIHIFFLSLQARLPEPVGQSDPTLSALKSMWDSLNLNSSSGSFLQLITSSFPSQKAEMAMRRELTSVQFFNTFELRHRPNEPQSASARHSPQWVCYLCRRAELTATLLQSDSGLPCLEGQLEKKRGRFQALQPWKLRHFKLDGTSITYNKNGLQLRTVDSIHEVRVIQGRRAVLGRGGAGAVGCMFKIYTTGGETLSLRSRDAVEAERWIVCLRVIIAHSLSNIRHSRVESINMGVI